MSTTPATMTDDWRLRQHAPLTDGDIAFDIFGAGPPVVLVHGTPSRSYLWRHIAPVLAERSTVYVFDLLGYGDSERRAGQDISIAAQARVLAELLDYWQVDAPAIAGHDIGGAIVLRTHLLEGRRFRRIALLDAVVFSPWITATTRHQQAHLDAYRTMPLHIYEQVAAAHLRTATHRPMDDTTLGAYLGQWRGSGGQEAWFQKVAQFDEEQTAAFEPLLGTIAAPVLIVWGDHDAWLDLNTAERLQQEIPHADLHVIADAGHFVMEDAPARVGQLLAEFFAPERVQMDLTQKVPS